MLLFSVLFALERHVLDRIDEVREETVEVSRRVEEVAAESANTRAALARLSTMTENAMRRRSEEIDEIFDAFENDVSVENTHRLLQLATDLRAIASEGVRVAIPNSWLRVRFKAAETAEHKVVLLRIEDLAGNELGTVTWVGDQGPEEIAVSLATELQRHGEFSPDFNAQPLFENLLSTVRTPVFARTRGEHGPADIGPVIEIPNEQWAVTADGLECLQVRYYIEWHRVWDPDWPRQMREKNWVDVDMFDSALVIGKALYRSRYLEEYGRTPRPMPS